MIRNDSVTDRHWRTVPWTVPFIICSWTLYGTFISTWRAGIVAASRALLLYYSYSQANKCGSSLCCLNAKKSITSYFNSPTIEWPLTFAKREHGQLFHGTKQCKASDTVVSTIAERNVAAKHIYCILLTVYYIIQFRAQCRAVDGTI
mgnify:CR=1 FL=1